MRRAAPWSTHGQAGPGRCAGTSASREGNGAERLWGRIERELLARVRILAFGEREAALAGDIGAELATEGQPVGTEDALIAATAMAHGLVVATRNAGHFSRVKTPRVITWWP